MTEKTYSVPDVHCGHCKASIEGAVSALDGVERVAVDIDGRSVEVAFADGVDEQAIVEAIEDQGYVVA